MLIHHTHRNRIAENGSNMKKEHKSTSKRKHQVSQVKTIVQVSRKNKALRKKLSKKNMKYLEELGLKVKQNH